MNIRLIALLTAILPVLAVHGTYLVAASYGQVDWCIPYIDSCTSISATGRKPPASYLFRATMLPCATIMMVFWWFNFSWLQALHENRGSNTNKTNNWMLLLGVVACLGLILYITVLGERGSAWATQRRIGTALFFSFSYVAQLLLLSQLHQLRAELSKVPDLLLRLCILVRFKDILQTFQACREMMPTRNLTKSVCLSPSVSWAQQCRWPARKEQSAGPDNRLLLIPRGRTPIAEHRRLAVKEHLMSTTDLVVDTQDIEFCLFEWLQIDQLQKFPKYEDYDAETLGLLVTEGMKFAVEVIAPTNREADREGCSIVDGNATVPKCLHSAYKQAYELGWASITASQEFGGQGAPEAIGLALSEAILGGNLALGMYFGLTQGAMELIESFGSEDLQNIYCEKMTSGEYTGTMCLSEPQAGSDVGAAKTSAEAVEGGKYRIKGSKCWISSGDNDLGSNVIHLVLARVKGDPLGTRGLSLFVVPKTNLNADGSLGESNDVTLVSIEDKMGIKASATAVLSFGDKDNCYGYLLGEQGDGMRMMFEMMNTERIAVAGMGLGIASAAYQNALAYARERVQGAHIDSIGTDPDAPSVPIIQHPDIRYSLTGMKARVEAIRALLYGACFIEDKMHITEDAEEKQKLNDFFQILTPMCKGWACETGLDVTRTGMQILGGVGFTKDFPMEQYYRDLRISAIYEGTTAIQALDLVGRKMTMKKGRLFMSLLGRFSQLFDANKDHTRLGQNFESWKAAYDTMTVCSMTFTEMAKEKGLSGAVLYATPFMFLLAGVTAGYFFLQQGLVAHDKLEELINESAVNADGLADFLNENAGARFYDNKLKTLDYFLNVLLPQYQSHSVPILNKNYAALDISF